MKRMIPSLRNCVIFSKLGLFNFEFRGDSPRTTLFQKFFSYKFYPLFERSLIFQDSLTNFHHVNCIDTETSRRMRKKSSSRGNGRPAGVHVPVVDGRDEFAASRSDGPCFRGGHARRDKSVVHATHEGDAALVLSGNRRTRSSSSRRCGDFSVWQIFHTVCSNKRDHATVWKSTLKNNWNYCYSLERSLRSQEKYSFLFFLMKGNNADN